MTASDLTTSLLELAARVEGGSGPDRELDAAVHIEVEGWTAREVFGLAGNTFTQYRDAGTLVCVPSHFTSSLDAVKALIERVLPGWIVQNLSEWEHEVLRSRGPWMAQLKKLGTPDLAFPIGCKHAPDPARALLAALLYAKASEMKGTAP